LGYLCRRFVCNGARSGRITGHGGRAIFSTHTNDWGK
jgi:hypothetical protein